MIEPPNNFFVSFSAQKLGENRTSAHAFLRFKAIKIQNGHCLNVQMKRARNYDSKTYVKKLNPTSKTNRIQIAMILFFLVHPVIIYFPSEKVTF